ncbi:MAG: DUF5403 family protein [Isosphaeraceae bacterium]
MAEVEWYQGRREFADMIAHMAREGVYEEGRDVERTAEALLEMERASTRWHKIHPETSPPGMTRVTGGEASNGTDYLVHLEALNPLALEYGHDPSGVFGEGGALGHIHTKAPEGLYILGRASGLAG